MTTEQETAIRTHGVNLQRIFPATRDLDPLALCRRVRLIEVKAHRLAERQCNEDMPEKVSDRLDAEIERRIEDVLSHKAAQVPVFVNGDPRGYALKIDDAWMRQNRDKKPLHLDWGGYGIIAPEIGKDGRAD